MLSSSLMSKFADNKTANLVSVTAVVDLQNSDLITKMADKLLTELERLAPYAGYAPVADLTSKDIVKYLSTLMWLRVCAVAGTTDKSCNAYRPLTKFLQVPVLMYQLLICVGTAYDKDFNIEFIPAYKVNEDDILSPDEMEALSSLFRQFNEVGLKCVPGMPNDTTGDLDFMAMCHVSDEVVSYRKSHPVYGFLAAFFRQQELNKVTGYMCRVLYGYESDYKYQIDALFNAIDG